MRVLLLATSVLLLLGLAGVCAEENVEEGFILRGIPYAFNALEPEIDTRTMELHWGRHHRAYTDNMNVALKSAKTNPGVSKRLRTAVELALTTRSEDALEEVVDIAVSEEEEAREVKPLLRMLRNNAGGYLNHNEYWSSLAPANLGGGVVDTPNLLRDEIRKEFTSHEAFQASFMQQGMSVFGSGWVWLVYDTKQHKLAITTTRNQDRPAPHLRVILACDVWEHAYYLKRENRRLEYLQAFFSRINMDAANQRLVDAKQKCEE